MESNELWAEGHLIILDWGFSIVKYLMEFSRLKVRAWTEDGGALFEELKQRVQVMLSEPILSAEHASNAMM